MWEVFYKFQVTDNITITPAIFGIDEDGRWHDEFRRHREDHLQVLIPRFEVPLGGSLFQIFQLLHFGGELFFGVIKGKLVLTDT